MTFGIPRNIKVIYVTLLACMLFLHSLSGFYKEYQFQSNALTTIGWVEKIEKVSQPSFRNIKGLKSTKLTVKYLTHKGETFLFSQKLKNYALPEDFHVGKKIIVLYFPDHPEEVKLYSPAPYQESLILFALSFFLSIPALWTIYRYRKQRRPLSLFFADFVPPETRKILSQKTEQQRKRDELLYDNNKDDLL